MKKFSFRKGWLLWAWLGWAASPAQTFAETTAPSPNEPPAAAPAPETAAPAEAQPEERTAAQRAQRLDELFREFGTYSQTIPTMSPGYFGGAYVTDDGAGLSRLLTEINVGALEGGQFAVYAQGLKAVQNLQSDNLVAHYRDRAAVTLWQQGAREAALQAGELSPPLLEAMLEFGEWEDAAAYVESRKDGLLLPKMQARLVEALLEANQPELAAKSLSALAENIEEPGLRAAWAHLRFVHQQGLEGLKAPALARLQNVLAKADLADLARTGWHLELPTTDGPTLEALATTLRDRLLGIPQYAATVQEAPLPVVADLLWRWRVASLTPPTSGSLAPWQAPLQAFAQPLLAHPDTILADASRRAQTSAMLRQLGLLAAEGGPWVKQVSGAFTSDELASPSPQILRAILLSLGDPLTDPNRRALLNKEAGFPEFLALLALGVAENGEKEALTTLHQSLRRGDFSVPADPLPPAWDAYQLPSPYFLSGPSVPVSLRVWLWLVHIQEFDLAADLLAEMFEALTVPVELECTLYLGEYAATGQTRALAEKPQLPRYVLTYLQLARALAQDRRHDEALQILTELVRGLEKELPTPAPDPLWAHGRHGARDLALVWLAAQRCLYPFEAPSRAELDPLLANLKNTPAKVLVEFRLLGEREPAFDPLASLQRIGSHLALYDFTVPFDDHWAWAGTFPTPVALALRLGLVQGLPTNAHEPRTAWDVEREFFPPPAHLLDVGLDLPDDVLPAWPLDTAGADAALWQWCQKVGRGGARRAMLDDGRELTALIYKDGRLSPAEKGVLNALQGASTLPIWTVAEASTLTDLPPLITPEEEAAAKDDWGLPDWYAPAWRALPWSLERRPLFVRSSLSPWFEQGLAEAAPLQDTEGTRYHIDTAVGQAGRAGHLVEFASRATAERTRVLERVAEAYRRQVAANKTAAELATLMGQVRALGAPLLPPAKAEYDQLLRDAVALWATADSGTVPPEVTAALATPPAPSPVP